MGHAGWLRTISNLFELNGTAGACCLSLRSFKEEQPFQHGVQHIDEQLQP